MSRPSCVKYSQYSFLLAPVGIRVSDIVNYVPRVVQYLTPRFAALLLVSPGDVLH